MNTSDGQLCPIRPGTARLDLYAAGLSTLCLLHCLALPLLVVLMPLAALAENEIVHQILVIVTIPISLRVLWKTGPIDAKTPFVGAVLIGLGLLLLGAFVETLSAYENQLTVVGGLLLGSAHIWNWLRQRREAGDPHLEAAAMHIDWRRPGANSNRP